MQTNQLFEQEKVTKRINTLYAETITIQRTVEDAFKKNQPKILEDQLQKIPHINRLTSVFAYSYEEWHWKQFNAKMSVCVDFIKKDIRSCIQIINKKQKGDLFGLQYGVILWFADILHYLEQQKKGEFLAFEKEQNEKEKQDTYEDVIISQKVRHFHKKRRQPQSFNKKKSTSFSQLPNPFAQNPQERTLQKIVEEVH